MNLIFETQGSRNPDFTCENLIFNKLNGFVEILISWQKSNIQQTQKFNIINFLIYVKSINYKNIK